ncbi:hypothetical protein CAQU_11935 [Corynebacterium aquilae DSM 44791]|uniref:GtrA/DPMS transmembrane domain-containing protein n=1 Tax=Corynebacterium aquilae DSM 44791 TaxID=1431546 RepID=A0A1L7CIN1_9CORY|nr:hypothetical protein CAQU_11935 [Corynebacterium aquilae DSM 44791]
MTKQLVRFVLVGIVSACVDYGSRTLLLHVVSPMLARGGSYILGSTCAYFLNSFFTFSGERTRAEMTRAALSYVFCFIAAVGVDAIVRNIYHGPMYMFLAWFFSQAVATVLNFLLQRNWVFQSRS